MALPRPLVLGNWKMNGLRADGLTLAGRLAERAVKLSGTLGVFPPATLLAQVAQRLVGTGIMVGGQDCHEKPSGAHTGSIAAPMLRDAGAGAVILGHSERRHGLGEDDALVQAKTRAALAAGLTAIVCIGETEEEYAGGRTLDVLERQIAGSLPLDLFTRGAKADSLVIAYEPVWAIGTGRTPSLDEIGRTHTRLAEMLGPRIEGDLPPLLYGGSVKPDNAADIMAIAHVDGALVGGASLDADGFWRIYTAGGGA
ncbi:MAG: triose-phosphate isomerase [Geminicoccaceae bacterium]|nr:triose-phosphate isomerase [Geminicoccaceae bacterium]